MTTGNVTEQLPGNTTAQNTRNLLRSIYRKRRPVWIVLAILVFAGCLSIGLFLFPQSYSAMTSISLSDSSSGSPQLALLTGAGGGKAKYLGPLKSRHFAEQVEKIVHLRDLYNLPTMDDAIEKIQRGVRFDDNTADGLLYITTSLEAPAKMARNTDTKRKRVENAAAMVCNAYALALKSYIVNNDTDKELVLLKSADAQIHEARANYEASIDRWIDFVRASKTTSMGMSGGGASQSPELAAIQTLFIKRGQLEVQLRASDAALAATHQLVGSANSRVATIPTEDELLTEARRRYTEAQRDIKDLLIQYAEQSPPVLRAKERLKIAEAHLHEQTQGILQGNTSEDIKRQALQVEYETVLSQIAQAERTVQVSKQSSTRFERLHAEVELNLKVLEASATREAELKMQTVSALKRINVVDEARPPSRGRPGMLMISLISALLAILAVLLWYGLEFTTLSSRIAASPVDPAYSPRQSEG
jgi:uncharacterized protein involved in exopolysaccharide biosynthesis